MNFWKDKKVFITGHTGFKGATLCKRLLSMGAHITGYSLEAPTKPNLFEIAKLDKFENLTTIFGDVRNLDSLKGAVNQSQPEIIFHLAAQSLVRNSYENPIETFDTNIMGTANLLESLRAYCSENDERNRKIKIKSVLIITTDKVYLNEGNRSKPFTEDEKLCGFDPYSNSKSGAELITYSYRNSFFKEENMPAISTARAGNVIGFGDFAKDRILPDCIKAAIKGKAVMVRNPYSIRPYQHVEDCIEGYMILAEKQFFSKSEYEGSYNFGPDDKDCITTGKLTEMFLACWKKLQPSSGFTIELNEKKEGPYEAELLKLDSKKAKSVLGWNPRMDIYQAVEKTAKDLYENIKSINLKDINEDGELKKPLKSQTEALAKDEILSLVGKYCEEFHKPQKSDRIPYAGRVYDKDEMINLVDSALEFWLTAGSYASQFEKEFAEFLAIKNCILVNSGSSANLLAFMTLTSPLLGDKAIKRGDEVITVAAGFPTTVAPMVQFGAVPVFVDVTIPEYNIDVTQLERAKSDKTKAVMLAHTLGNPFDIKSVKEFCKRYGLWLIEDNCDALGSKYCLNGNWKYTGTFGDIGTSSFYPPHHMTMGEGGAVYTDDPLLAKIAISMRDWGRDCQCPSGMDNLCEHRFDKQYGQLPLGYDHKYVYSHFGYNLKATDMQAAIGVAQLKKLPGFIEARKSNFKHIKECLTLIDDVELVLPVATENSQPCWFGFLITCKNGETRNAVVRHLEGKGIQTRMLFAGNILKHPCFEGMRENSDYRVVGELINTNIIMNDAFWVGVYPGMTVEMLERMVEGIREFQRKQLT